MSVNVTVAMITTKNGPKYPKIVVQMSYFLLLNNLFTQTHVMLLLEKKNNKEDICASLMDELYIIYISIYMEISMSFVIR